MKRLNIAICLVFASVFSFGQTHVLDIPNGGTNGATAQSAFDNLAPSCSSAGCFIYWSGSHYVKLDGNSGSVECLQETSGSPAWGACGGVTSVGLTMDGVIFNAIVSGSPVTGTGTFLPSLKTQNANCVLAGPTSGSAATPTCRSLVNPDLPPAPIQVGFPTLGTTASGFAIAGYAGTFPANFTGGVVKCITAPGATITFTLIDVTTSTTLGTVQVNSSCVGTFATTGGTTQSFSSGDFLKWTPSATDSTAVGLAVLTPATRK